MADVAGGTLQRGVGLSAHLLGDIVAIGTLLGPGGPWREAKQRQQSAGADRVGTARKGLAQGKTRTGRNCSWQVQFVYFSQFQEVLSLRAGFNGVTADCHRDPPLAESIRLKLSNGNRIATCGGDSMEQAGHATLDRIMVDAGFMSVGCFRGRGEWR